MRPIFTVHAGEYLAASAIERRFRNLQVWIPSRDTGVDLLVTDRHQEKVASLQVKFSKDYQGTSRGSGGVNEIAAGGWWTFQRSKIATSPADYWALVLYRFKPTRFDFVIIPPGELLARYDLIRPRAKSIQKSIQSYFCVTTSNRCWEVRGLDKAAMVSISSGTYSEPKRDFSKFLNKWPFEKRSV